MLTIGLNPVEVREVVGRELPCPIPAKDAGKTDHGVQRSAQLVAHARKKVALCLARRLGGVASPENRNLVPFPVRDVRQGAEGADDLAVRVLEGSPGQLQPGTGTSAAQHLQLVAIGVAAPPPLETSLGIAGRIGVGEQLRCQSTDEIALYPTGELECALVHE